MAITAKDLSLSVKEAEDFGVPMWIGQAVQQIWKFAVSQGGADQDGTSLITFLEPMAGVKVQAGTKAEVPRAAIASRNAPRELAVLCDPAKAAAMQGRLAREGWDVARLGRPVGSSEIELHRGERRCTLVPLTESGQLAKVLQTFDRSAPCLVINTCLMRPSDALALAATCESYVTGAKAGLAASTMLKILGIETGRNSASAHILPNLVAARRFSYGKTIREACIELALLSAEADRLGVTCWILDKARLLYALASRLGDPSDDISCLALHYEQWAKTEVRNGPMNHDGAMSAGMAA
jgi:hypothetical protein